MNRNHNLRSRAVMRMFSLFFGGIMVALSSLAQSPAGWTLVWSDEFTQPDGSSPDATKWGFDTGGGGWGNNELQYYTSRTNNARIEDGHLVIEAHQENFGNRTNTSARLLTKGKWSWAYGRFEARLKIPRGQGIWPAFWMLGANFDAVGWPSCGEIDIMENIGREPNLVHGTIHGPGYSGGNSIGGAYSLPGGAPFADDFHIYAVEWTTNQIKWFVDGQPYLTLAPANLPNGTTWVFSQPQFLLLNVAVGGQWPGYPDATTTFPQRMTVDYVRVYKRSPVAGCGANILTNPGFETGGLANWTAYGGNNSLDTGWVQEGAQSLKVFGQFPVSGVENYSGAFQDIPSSPGDDFRADAWLLTPPGDQIAGANTAWVEVSFRDTGANILALYRTALVNTNTPVGDWLNLAVTNQVNPANGAVIATVTNLVAPAGTTFVRMQTVFRQLANAPGSVRFDNLTLFQQAGVAPPTIESLSPDGTTPFVNPSNHLSFQTRSPCAGIATNGIQVSLNGVDVSPQLLITGSATNWSVTFPGLTSNVIYSATITVTDVNGLLTSTAWQFDTFSQANFMWEAEDFDFGGGQFINNPIPSSTARTNSYFGRVGQQGIDKNETSHDGDRLYRPADSVATLLPTDFTRQKFLEAIQAGDLNAKDYKVGYYYPGEWLNYTRDFPAGDYRIYGRLAGGAGATQLHLDRVTAGQGTTGQSTERLGSFSFTGLGWQSFNFVPLRDTNGVLATVNLGANATLRATATGGTDPNYFMLVPTLTPVRASAVSSGTSIVIYFVSQAGVSYLVRYKSTLPGTAWQTLTTLTGDGTIKSVTDSLTADQRFYQVVRL